jgi:hypothetical protein
VGIILALTLAAPVVGLQSDGAVPCDASAFARDLRTLRPELTVVPLDGSQVPPAGAWIAHLEGLLTGQPLLRVTGSPTPLVRALPGQDCRRVVEIAASIIDGLLDELPHEPPREGPEASVAAVHWRPSLGIWFGAGVLQGPIKWVPSIALGLRLGLGDWEVVGASDLGFLAALPFATSDVGVRGPPCTVADCFYRALPFDFEIGGGYAPRLGPGNLSLDALAGPSVVHAWAKGSPLFSTGDKVTLVAFVALAAGYTIDLPARFFVGARVEERWSPVQPKFDVDGASDSVDTRIWTFTSAIFAGWRFF